MNCEKISELLFEYVNGELDNATVEKIEAHLAECEDCKKEYELLLGMSESINNASYEAPAELHGVIMSGIAAEKKRIRRAKLIKNLTVIGASAAAFVLTVNVIFTNLDKALDKGNDSPNGAPSHSIVLNSDNIFTTESATPDGTIELSQNTASRFVGEWTTALKNGRTVTMWINEDLSVVVRIKDRNGFEVYYDGMLEFSSKGITLSQSDGNKSFKATVQMLIDDGELFFDIVKGNTPWGEAT